MCSSTSARDGWIGNWLAAGAGAGAVSAVKDSPESEVCLPFDGEGSDAGSASADGFLVSAFLDLVGFSPLGPDFASLSFCVSLGK